MNGVPTFLSLVPFGASSRYLSSQDCQNPTHPEAPVSKKKKKMAELAELCMAPFFVHAPFFVLPDLQVRIYKVY